MSQKTTDTLALVCVMGLVAAFLLFVVVIISPNIGVGNCVEVRDKAVVEKLWTETIPPYGTTFWAALHGEPYSISKYQFAFMQVGQPVDIIIRRCYVWLLYTGEVTIVDFPFPQTDEGK